MQKRILGVYDTACLVSLAGAAAAVSAIFLSLHGMIELALVGLIIAGVADLFDGVIARRMQRSEFAVQFGAQLDTTVDVLSFVVTPVVIVVSTVLPVWPLLLAAMAFVLAGVIRLAHFNTLQMQRHDQSTHHRGLPVTYSALIFPLLFLLRGNIGEAVFSQSLALVFFITGALFITDVPVRKPGGIFYLLLPALAVALSVTWVTMFLLAGD